MPDRDTSKLALPVDRVVGIAPDPATLRRSVQALTAAGVPDGAVAVRCNEQDAGRFTADDDDGALTSLVHTVQRVLGDEREKLERLDAALAAGKAVVEVELDVDEDASDDVVDARKREIGAALVHAGADEVSYYGPWAVEDLDLTV